MSTPLLFSLFILALSIPAGLHASPGGEERFISHARQLTFEGLRSGEGYFRGDGGMLVFQSEREAGNPFYQMYTLDFSSGETRRISNGIGKTTCGFFQPGTRRLLYSSTQEDPEAGRKQKEELEFRASGKTRRYSWDYDPQYEIYSANEDGSDVRKLTDSVGYDAEAAFSPDGQWVVFSSTRGAYPLEKLSAEDRARFEKDPAYFADLYVMRSDGSEVRQLTRTPGYDGGPFFSPDGGRIVWRRFDASGMHADVFSVKTDGTDVRRMTAFESMSWAPFFHPSGAYVVFTSNKFGFENFELFLVDALGEREPVRVTTTDGFDGLPVFSPDGKQLCWTSNRGGEKRSQLFLADWNHAAALEALAAAPVRPRVVGQEAGKGEGFGAAISEGDLRAQVEWLAAPEREGRRTGSAGAAASADWLLGYLKRAGLEPLNGQYTQEFEFPAGVELLAQKNRLSVIREGKETGFALDQDFRPLSFSESGTVEGEVVFGGYGLSVPEGNGGYRYNSYEGLDVKDKVVLLLRYVPEGVDAKRRAQLNHYAGLRYKAMMARERGAKAVLVVSGPNSPQPGELLGLSSDNTVADSGIVAHSVSAKVAEVLLAGTGKSLKEVQTALDSENPHEPAAYALPGVKVKVEAGVEHRKGRDRNVVAAIAPGPGGVEEWVVVGAHYDHLGKSADGSSLARSGEEKQVHFGADDNASGTAVVMELAAALAEERRRDPSQFRRGVLIGFWSGEEIGLMGSAAFAEKGGVEMSRCVAYLNFDMVGRLRDNKLNLQGIGSSKGWRRLIEKRNVAAGFNLTLQEDPYLPTDTTSFYPKKVPVLSFFTGSHEDYHRPTDLPGKVEYAGMERIARFAHGLVRDLVGNERLDFVRVERSRAQEGSGSRETLRAYIGSIPDYAADLVGVKLSGVRAGSPAEKAGLQGGDVIVEFGSQKVRNIYDFTYALDAVKIGQAVEVTVQREGKTVKLTVIPEARK
jgi:Tol biopolymer transport system component